jgi:hypothetical protein
MHGGYPCTVDIHGQMGIPFLGYVRYVRACMVDIHVPWISMEGGDTFSGIG